jgi:hypothetical protein
MGGAGVGGTGGMGGAGVGGAGVGGAGGAGGNMMAVEICGNGIDDNANNLTDCADPACANAAACGKILINEVDYDESGSDKAEFIEIYNAGNSAVDLSTVIVELVAGSNNNVYTEFPLTGTLAAGAYFVVGNASVTMGLAGASLTIPDGSIQNGGAKGDAIALYDSAKDGLLDSISYEGAITAANIKGKMYSLVHGNAATALDDANPLNPIRSMIRFPNGASTGDDATDWKNTTSLTPGVANLLSAESCGNMLDDDFDGLVDCADPDCAGNAMCVSVEICDNHIDDNANGLIDCADPLCANQICGLNGQLCAANVCACPGGATESNCTDGIDNNCDGLVDCADPGCAADPACVAASCMNGMKDGSETDIDCGGPTCNKCADLKKCVAGTDCVNGSCIDGVCQDLWINEIHYDNGGANDVDEGVEVAGTANMTLSGWTVVPYNGSNGNTYSIKTLNGVMTPVAAMATVGVWWVPISGFQNGAPDGVALVSPMGTVVQFLSYEATVMAPLVAMNGPAMGMTAVDIKVSEGGAALASSLQLSGTGHKYSDFTWQAEAAATYPLTTIVNGMPVTPGQGPSSLNNNQVFQ